MGIFFFKLPKHYVFDYKPLYYDEKKEERERRFKSIDRKLRQEKGLPVDDEEEYRPDIRFRKYLSYHRRSNISAVIRLVSVLSIAVIIYLLVVYSDLLTKFIGFLVQNR